MATKAWLLAHVERVREIKRESAKRRYHADLEKSRAKARAATKRFIKRRPERWAALAKKARMKRLRLKPEKVAFEKRLAASVRRSRARATTIEPINYERIMKRDRMRCHVCRKTVTRASLHFDHVIPLALGGTHTEANIAVSHAKCNLRKFTKVLTLF